MAKKRGKTGRKPEKRTTKPPQRKPFRKPGHKPEKRGPKTPDGKARALANLRPPFQIGNPGGPGRPAAGMTVRDWYNEMQGWNREEVEAVVRNPNEPNAKAAAARVWMDARSEDRTASGVPIAGPELDRIADRTVGKAKQEVDVTSAGEKIVSGFDLSKLAIERLEALWELLEEAKPDGSDDPDPR